MINWWQQLIDKQDEQVTSQGKQQYSTTKAA